MNVRVYRYGLMPPNRNASLVAEQMRAAHRYHNTLIEIERGRRAAKRAAAGDYERALAGFEAEAAKADAAVEDLARQIKAAKATARSRTAPPELLAAHAQAKAQRRQFAGTLRLARAWLRDDPGVQARLAEIDRLAGELQRNAREHCGVYWGTYLMAEDAWQAAAKMPLYDGVEPTDPRFMRWTGDAAVGVQIQGGEDAAALLGGDDTRLRIVRARLERPGGKRAAFRQPADPNSRRSRRRAEGERELWMRVGSDGRDPVWATWPMFFDRPIPEGARVKRASVSRRMIGPREEWSVQITVELPDPAPARRHGGSVAIDLGWRLIGDEIRVAVWRGEDGATGEIRLSANDVQALRIPEGLASTRALAFDREVARLAGSDQLDAHGVAGWITTHAVPEWLSEATRTMRQWRSPARLAALGERWRGARFPGDEEAFDALWAWRQQDRHLWLWETGQRTGGHRRRDDVYRCAVAKLAERYDTLVIEDFDLRAVAQRGELGREPDDNEAARANRQLAAPYKLRLFAKQAFAARGGRVVEMSGADSTHTCPECGLVQSFDAAKMITWACEGCCTIHDQDESAARVLLEGWVERRRREQMAWVARESENTSEVQEVRETRWQRAKRLSAEKKSRAEGARKPVGNDAESRGS